MMNLLDAAASVAPAGPDPADDLTPAMRGVVERVARAGHPPFWTLSPEAAKSAYARGADVLEIPRATLARVEDFTVRATDGSALPARLYAGSADELPTLLYFHGGGFTIGSIETHDILCRELARRSGCAVVSLDYRLAPDHRFPIAVDDAWDALHWLTGGGARSLGLASDRFAVGGDSAGATLAAVCALRARDAGMPVAFQLLFYPGCAARGDTPSRRRRADDPLLPATQIDWFFSQYIDEADRSDWRFAPLEAGDVSGVAPAWIGLAEADPLVDEGIAYADRLRFSGVPVSLEIYRGVTHEFIKMGRAIPEARLAHAQAAAALAAALSTAPDRGPNDAG